MVYTKHYTTNDVSTPLEGLRSGQDELYESWGLIYLGTRSVVSATMPRTKEGGPGIDSAVVLPKGFGSTVLVGNSMNSKAHSTDWY